MMEKLDLSVQDWNIFLHRDHVHISRGMVLQLVVGVMMMIWCFLFLSFKILQQSGKLTPSAFTYAMRCLPCYMDVFHLEHFADTQDVNII